MYGSHRTRYFACILGVFLGASCFTKHAAAIVRRHDREDARFVEAAVPLSRAGFVVRVGRGCGTLITDRHVLTAAHVVDRFTAYGPSLRIGQATRKIVRISVHPKAAFQPGETVRHDIAVLELDAAITNIKPARLASSEPDVRSPVWLAGYGDFGDGMTGPKHRSDGKLRAATNRLHRVNSEWLMFRFDAPGKEALDLEGISGTGDSGSGAYLETPTGWTIVGVSSWNDGEGDRFGKYGSLEYYGSVARYSTWINRCIKTPEQAPMTDRIVAGPLPDTRAGRFLQELIALFGDCNDSALAVFTTKWLRHGTTNAEARQQVHKWREMFGQLRPDRYHSRADHTLAVEFESNDGSRKLIRVYLDYGPAGRLLAIRSSTLETDPEK